MSETQIKIKPQMRLVEIFCCPENGCRKKTGTIKNLNIHLSMKHQTKYKIELIDGSTPIVVMR